MGRGRGGRWGGAEAAGGEGQRRQVEGGRRASASCPRVARMRVPTACNKLATRSLSLERLNDARPCAAAAATAPTPPAAAAAPAFDVCMSMDAHAKKLFRTFCMYLIIG